MPIGGRESTSYLGLKVWEHIPSKINNITSLDGFKKILESGNL